MLKTYCIWVVKLLKVLVSILCKPRRGEEFLFSEAQRLLESRQNTIDGVCLRICPKMVPPLNERAFVVQVQTR